MKQSTPSESFASSRPFLLVWLAYSLIVLLGVRFLLFPSGFAERMDFRQLYAGGYLIRTDPAQVYDLERQKAVEDTLVAQAPGLLPFNHPAYEALFFAPFSLLSYRSAYVCFLCCNLLVLATCFFCGRDALARPGTMAQPRAGWQLFAFFPILIAVLQGQDSLLLLLGLCLVYRCLKSERRFVAGLLLGLVLFKFQIALPLAVFLVARFGMSLLMGFISGSLLVCVTSLLATGGRAFQDFGRTLLLTGSANLAESTPNGILGVVPLAMPNLKGLLSAITLGRVPGKALLVVTVLASATIALWIIQKLRTLRPANALSFSLSVAAAVLLSYHLHIQDLTVLQLPLGLTAGVRNASLSRAALLCYVAPPLLALVGRDALFLLSLPVILLLHGVAQTAKRTVADSEGADSVGGMPDTV